MSPKSIQSICVVVAAFNAADTISRCVKSALMQPEVAELIIADDYSSDDTVNRAVQAAGGDERLRILRLEVNSGPSVARNAAIRASSAELLCVLDADDWMQEHRLSRLLSADHDWDLLADDLLIADEVSPLTFGDPLLGVSEPFLVDGKTFVTSNISRADRPRQELGYLKPIMRRDFLMRNQLAYDPALRLGEDYILYAEALLAGARFRVVPACGYVAVRRRGSLSHLHGASELAALADADRRLIKVARSRSPAMTAPLSRHFRAVSRERDFRRMLDAKARKDWAAVIAHGLRTPATAAYIGHELWQAKRQTSRPS